MPEVLKPEVISESEAKARIIHFASLRRENQMDLYPWGRYDARIDRDTTTRLLIYKNTYTRQTGRGTKEELLLFQDFGINWQLCQENLASGSFDPEAHQELSSSLLDISDRFANEYGVDDIEGIYLTALNRAYNPIIVASTKISPFSVS